MPQTLTSKVIIRSDAIKVNGKAPVCLQVFINGQRKVIRLGFDIRPEYFDKVAQRPRMPKGDKEEEKDMRMIIAKAMAKTQRIFFDALAFDTILDREMFVRLYEDQGSARDFYKWMKEMIELEAEIRSPDTVRMYGNTMYELTMYKKECFFSDLTYDFVAGFDRHLKKTGKVTNTVWRFHKDLRKFINLAIKKKLMIYNPYSEFKLQKARTEPVYLTFEELQRLIELYDSQALNNELQSILRQFLFMCATGIRISDVRMLTEENIINDVIVWRPYKTRNSRMIQKNTISEFAIRMIEDARGEHPERLFNVTTDKNVNDYIKQIAHFAEIEKNITTKVGRHTFATLFLESGGKVEVLQRILGHSKIETTMVYVHISRRQQKAQMQSFDDFIYLKRR